ncbi:unnamed protein product [Aureobasidium mustum]|uniref:Uncharacterized protein n=1 Tax=Aureobasidium mustum TaxID=2773714 RepID=A0A9N8P7M9_9PEZI|nr:unnamed protein product [Aureobasidium mustum]
MALFNRSSSSSSLKSEKSAANTKKNVRFSNQPLNSSLKTEESTVSSGSSTKSEAEKKSSASAGMPQSKPSKSRVPLYNKKHDFDILKQSWDYQLQLHDGVSRRLGDKLATYTYEELLDLEKTIDPSLDYFRLRSNLEAFRRESVVPIGLHTCTALPVGSVVLEQDNSARYTTESEPRLIPSHSLDDNMHANLAPDLIDASNKTLSSLEKGWEPSSDKHVNPLRLGSSSPEAGSENEERIIYQNHMARPSTGKDAAPPPRFINPAKVTKLTNEERCIGSYLNQHQLYMLRRKETQLIRKLETKTISQLQMLQHKASTCHASNKIKNLIQNTLFEKHLAEMKEWESQLDVWSKNSRDEPRTRTDNQEIQGLRKTDQDIFVSLTTSNMVIDPTYFIPLNDRGLLMRDMKPFGDSSDEEIIDVEESDEQALANQAKQVTDTNITTATANLYNSKGQKVSQRIPGPGSVATSSKTLATKGTASKVTKPIYNKQLGKLNQKLRGKTLEELLKMHDETTQELFRDIIKDAYHEKRMAMLKEWEEQIGD